MRLAMLVMLLAACGGGAGPVVTPPPGAVVVAAAGESFSAGAVTAPAGAAFTIFFDITDSSQHNLRIWDGDASVAATDVFGGPSARTLEVPPLAPGDYRMTCDIHPSMLATLTAD